MVAMMVGASETAPIAAKFTSQSPSVQPFHLSPPAFLAQHFSGTTPDTVARPSTTAGLPPPSEAAIPAFLATSAIVFDQHTASPSEPRVLLIQRAPHDSKPLRWETPGGGCDDDDESMLHACARELCEETGLMARSVGPLVRLPQLSREGDEEMADTLGGHVFRTRSGKVVCKLYFVVDVQDSGAVVLDPAEHVGYVWATEEAVMAGKMGLDKESENVLEFTTMEQRDVLLEAFKQLKQGTE
jgi:8-oxo-dGTP pyrophosphatase MutT (NUDIX family)